MKLLKFKVTDFRAVIDTGWIDCQDVTAFVGENESGKTTLFMALLKLMPKIREPGAATSLRSNLGSLSAITKDDIPIDRFEELIATIDSRVFIQAVFDVDSELNGQFMEMSRKYSPVETFCISKTYGGEYTLDIFGLFEKEQRNNVLNLILSRLPVFLYFKEVTEFKSDINLAALAYKLIGDASGKRLTANETIYANLLNFLDIWQSNLIKSIKEVYPDFEKQSDKEVDFNEIFKAIPMFKNRFDAGFKILSEEFKRWWGSGEISIDWEICRKGVRIKIIDDGEVYLLENRSTGFRRFFALFLSFSVSAKRDFENAILLFDEAGAALHPITQRKLAGFFNTLSANSQILFNTHTSYMLNVEDINRVRVVYKDKSHHIRVSNSLTVNKDRTNEESLFPVQSALALFIAENAMAGCLPVVVLNKHDEAYLSLTKNLLTAKGRFSTIQTVLVFAAGANGIDSVAEAFSEDDADKNYPVILLASDQEGKEIKARLRAGKYINEPQKVLELSDLAGDAVTFEDLIPGSLNEMFSRVYLKSLLGDGFVYDKREGLIKQIQTYVQKNGIVLPAGFRSELAKRMKINTLMNYKDIHIPFSYMAKWKRIWRALIKK